MRRTRAWVFLAMGLSNACGTDPLQRVRGHEEPPPLDELEEPEGVAPDLLGFDADIYHVAVGEPVVISVLRTGTGARPVSALVNILGGTAGSAFLQPASNQVRLDFAPGDAQKNFLLTPLAPTTGLQLELVVPAPERAGLAAATVHIANPPPQCSAGPVLEKLMLVRTAVARPA